MWKICDFMIMADFSCDYLRGAHPGVLQALVATNMLATPGYGVDTFTHEAQRVILEACGLDEGQVWLLEGGTQTNSTVIDALLTKCEGVIATRDSHINVHEAGAIESCGHKVLTLDSVDGKLRADDITRYVDSFYRDDTWPHMVIPGMVYITQPTELGTLYTLEELTAVSEVCRKRGLPLYLDGARLAYALASPRNDVTLPDIARLCDAFYIGGTKCGALFGEAVVFPRPLDRVRNFFTLVKQHGALMAKGRLLGVQFLTLFSRDTESGKLLYEEIGDNGCRCAARIRELMLERGYKLFMDSPTNQQFFILPNEVINRLEGKIVFELWGPPRESETPVRFVADWATADADIVALREALDLP